MHVQVLDVSSADPKRVLGLHREVKDGGVVGGVGDESGGHGGLILYTAKIVHFLIGLQRTPILLYLFNQLLLDFILFFFNKLVPQTGVVKTICWNILVITSEKFFWRYRIVL